MIKFRLMKFVVLFLIFSLQAAVCAAQETCRIASERAPLLLNLQIGISPETARAAFGKDLKIKIKKNGERTFFQNYVKNPAPERLRGVRALYLRFFDRGLYQIEVFYEPRADLPTLEAVKNALSDQYGLPLSEWQIENNRAEIKCGDVSLVADHVLNPRVELTDEIVRRRVEAAREKDKK